MEKNIYRSLINYDFSRLSALCSIVEWKGSVPRKDYPIMLVLDSGDIVGTIGGGSMEKSVIQLAGSVMQTQRPQVDHFNFTNNDINVDGGLCGGTLQVLIEPFTPELQSFWKSVKLDTYSNDLNMLLTSFNSKNQAVTRKIINSAKIPKDYPYSLIALIQSAYKKRKTRTLMIEKTLHLIQVLERHPVLHIFGAGHVGKAVADLAHFTGLDVYIYDDRESFVTQDRFPHVLKRISTPLPSILKEAVVRSHDITLVATRDHYHDLALVRFLVNKSPGWIGLVSSRRKWKMLSQALADEGLSPESIAAVKAPVGLRIKAATVPEIAVSIIGEIIQHVRAPDLRISKD